TKIARLYGRELPVVPLPRQVYLLKHPTVNLEPLPFFLDYPQDIYFRYYERDHQPVTLVSWIAAMEAAELVGGWVGHYELSPDKGAIVGPVPGRAGLFNYCGLSAHGV